MQVEAKCDLMKIFLMYSFFSQTYLSYSNENFKYFVFIFLHVAYNACFQNKTSDQSVLPHFLASKVDRNIAFSEKYKIVGIYKIGYK